MGNAKSMVRDAAESMPNAITPLIFVLISGVTVFICLLLNFRAKFSLASQLY
jgi:hypothetical protein